MLQTIPIQLNRSPYQYDVLIGQGIFKAELQRILADYKEENIYVVTNDLVHGIYPNFVQECLPENLTGHLLILPDGEEFKNVDSINSIYDFLADHQANRHSLLIAFGGGVIGDMVGFAAASFMRGIGYIQVPTTLLSQVDSSIGGKTGYNHRAGKNFIGAFKQPLRTIIDTNFLNSLPLREFKAGYAELLKHALIKDASLFEFLEQRSIEKLKEDHLNLAQAIFRSCEVKAKVVQEDELEKGERAKLNFGHTLGHYVENFTEYKGLLHGESVHAGMEFAVWWSVKYSGLPASEAEAIYQHLSSLGLRFQLKEIKKEDFITIIAHDKKAHAQWVRFIAIERLGSGVIHDKVTPESLWEDYLEFLQSERILQQTLLP